MPLRFPILLVDDDPNLVEILQKAAEVSFPEAIFTQVHNFNEVVQYINSLEGNGPKLLLLDIDLQDKMTGFDVISFLGQHPQARLLPVLMFTVSQSNADLKDAYELGAASYTLKPFSFGQWVTYLGTLRAYWVKAVTLPKIKFIRQSV